MKKLLLVFLLLVAATTGGRAQNPLFDDTKVASIWVEMPQDSFDFLIDHLVNDRYLAARFIFESNNPTVRDTVETTGIRLRGNTSLSAQKKSFKLSFNEFESGRRYRGVKKLNLIGSHNDPTMARQKLFYDIWNRFGLPERRVSFVKLYVNGAYRGVYSNVEEIDKEWLERAYGDDSGNLYKCTYPADLVSLGTAQGPYKAILNNPTSRAYDLVTNETADDYSGFVNFVVTLNQPTTGSAYATNLQQVLNVDGYLKALAVEVATGHWDDYSYNKNNYYLYHDPVSGRFEFTSYDGDNTLGVDWVNRDWARRNVYQWQRTNEPRPLTTQLLAVPAFKAAYTRYLDTLARLIVHPDSIFPRVDFLHNLLTGPAGADTWRTLDYGYTIGDFHNGFTQTVDDHTPYGIKPFLALRRDSILAQIAPFLPTVSVPEVLETARLRVYPNPTHDHVRLDWEVPGDVGNWRVEWLDLTGRVVKTVAFTSATMPLELPLADLPPGLYGLKILGDQGLLGCARVLRL